MEYEDGLDRAIESTSDVEGSTGRFLIPDPDVRQEGNVTVYENFQSTLDALDREATHLMKFIQTELGTSATIDDRGRLRLTGEFGHDRIETAIEAYAERYVLCPACGLPDTRLETENGAEIRHCTACGARSPVGR
ncbi:MAG: translation initiation factor IF-2 subunit beta [Natronomonas sp.]|uniref:translation initiation factor IF-2 subunit beta n=1 Tax=Natronomonas sp. TaxID=2184060 RepID=UPI00286FCBF3|nr:translation initiation factor IF-2 subunit beta [Natronomonas sp.]MDR9382411.1 translation initiation factor IF-2 subunit beta [Natronomonas sp.]MDR9429292.1 translation initiation factor IF-2 subunit beta [Natronomonas sp.]